MRVGLIDVDGHNFPNLALMKISAYFKERGDMVEWQDGLTHYDIVYLSKVFSFTPDHDTYIKADWLQEGGTGYGLFENLPEEIDCMAPDYSIYPDFKVRVCKRWEPYAIGFLTRGCIRSCPWCIVPKKEGAIRPYRAWEEVKRPDSRNVVFMDNNVLACDWGIEQIARMGGQPVWVDFNQGLDARLITPEIAGLLKRLHWIRFVRMSCDTDAMLPVIEQATAYLREAGIGRSLYYCYVLVTDVPEALLRIQALEAMGVTVFAQPYRSYDAAEPTEEQRRFAQWVNQRGKHASCDWEDFKKPGWKNAYRKKEIE